MPILVTGSVLLPYAAGFVQNSAKIAPADPFIGTIETMKRSIAPLTCVEQKGSRSNLLERTGTVFFVSSNGGFLTAAHALLEMQKPNRYCPITAVTLPEMRWTPEAREESSHGSLLRFPFAGSTRTWIWRCAAHSTIYLLEDLAPGLKSAQCSLTMEPHRMEPQ
jgi:hypothetical protein